MRLGLPVVIQAMRRMFAVSPMKNIKPRMLRKMLFSLDVGGIGAKLTGAISAKRTFHERLLHPKFIPTVYMSMCNYKCNVHCPYM